MTNADPPQRHLRSGLLPLGVMALAGAGAWLLLVQVTGKAEAWDDPRYFQLAMPVLAAVAAVLGWLRPGQPVLLGLVGAAGQAAVLPFTAAGLGLWPIGAGFLLAFSLPTMAAAWLGGRLRRGAGGPC